MNNMVIVNARLLCDSYFPLNDNNDNNIFIVVIIIIIVTIKNITGKHLELMVKAKRYLSSPSLLLIVVTNKGRENLIVDTP